MTVYETIAMFTAPSASISPFDARLVRLIRTLQDELGGLVPSATIADRLAMPGRTVRYYLRRVEAAGYVSRPQGKRSGYSAMRGAICSMAVRDSIQRQADVLNPMDVTALRALDASEKPVQAKALLDGVPARTLQYRLRRLEKHGFVHRPQGKRSGYAIKSARAMRICAFAEAQQIQAQVDPFERRTMNEIRWRQQFCSAISSRLLAEYLDLPHRSMKYYLRGMERKHLVHRPHGKKAGYRLTAVAIAVLDMGEDDGTLN